jgi:hypothetical protein
VEDLFQESRLTIARIGVDVEREQHRALGSRLRSITKACLTTLGAPDDAALTRTLTLQLPALGIKSFCVSRFTRGPGATAELAVVARRAEGMGGAAPQTLLSRELGLDPALLLEEALVVEPLEFRGEPVGLAVLAWGARDALHYEQLRELLGPAIHVERGKLER